MARPARAPLLFCMPAAIGGLVAIASITGCGTSPPQDPSYLLVELRNEASAATTASSVLVEVIKGTETLTTLCVKLADPGAPTPASFVLQRDFGKDASARVTVKVTAFESLSGDESAAAGKELACPSGALPPPLADPQIVEADFCEGKARKIVFHVGASCTCDEASVCGAGLSTTGNACAPSECCARSISGACALESPP